MLLSQSVLHFVKQDFHEEVQVRAVEVLAAGMDKGIEVLGYGLGATVLLFEMPGEELGHKLGTATGPLACIHLF